MRKTISLLALLFVAFSAIAQTSNTVTASNTTPATSININDTIIYTDVDSVATFPGGKPAWFKFVANTLDAAVGVDNGAKKGRYEVKIKFTVTKDGTLKDFQPETKYGYGLEEEVIKMLKLSPKWVPAQRNNQIVNSAVIQTQVFIISKG